MAGYVRKTLAGAKIGDSIVHRNMVIFPLEAPIVAKVDYMLLEEALEHKTITVREVDMAGSVGTIQITVHGERSILIIDGEELVGAKQNRVLNCTVLLPGKKTTRVPVSCVEQGRWDHGPMEFSAGHASPSSLRKKMCESVATSLAEESGFCGDQGLVWDEVSERLEDAGCSDAAPTQALSVEYVHAADRVEEYVCAFEVLDGRNGVAVFIDGRLVGADIFDRSDTLGTKWQKLVASYALDAVSTRRRRRGKAVEEEATAQQVEAFLAHASEAGMQSTPSPGLGQDVRLQHTGLTGQGLGYKQSVVHLSLFRENDRAPEGDKPLGKMASASHRRSGRH